MIRVDLVKIWTSEFWSIVKQWYQSKNTVNNISKSNCSGNWKKIPQLCFSSAFARSTIPIEFINGFIIIV